MLAVVANTSSEDWVNDAADDVGGLDLLLSEAARGVLRLFRPDMPALARLGDALARRPGLVGSQLRSLGGAAGRIAAGRSEISPSPRDRRFSEPAWSGNPLLHRILHAYLAGGTCAESLLDGAE